jgi:hypothetical protein
VEELVAVGGEDAVASRRRRAKRRGVGGSSRRLQPLLSIGLGKEVGQLLWR